MKAIVVGGGIGGLSVALSLHQVGIEARVYEAVRHLNAGLPANTILFHQDATGLGVWWEFRADINHAQADS